MTKCKGKTTAGKECKYDALDYKEYCEWHDPDTPKCGQLTRTGNPCKIPATRCNHHSRGPVGTDPKIFRIDRLRTDVEPIVRVYRQDVDKYRNEVLPRTMKGLYFELDHVVELHIIRDCYDSIRKHGTNFADAQGNLQKELRCKVNHFTNLNFTTKDINRYKFKATDEFQKLYLSNQSIPDQGLFDLLQESDGKRLSRQDTKRIQGEMYNSWKAIEDMIEHEQPLQVDFEEILNANMSAMKLK
jgi:hypothetical protein